MKRSSWIFSLIIIALLTSCAGTKDNSRLNLQLNGRWEFRQSGDSIWLEATVPGTVHTDLYKNVIIEDPFFRLNEKKYQWIDKVNWEYRKQFVPNQELFKKDHVILKFEGLDTYADVFFNGQSILHADNMFRTWTADIRHLLRKGETNEILILFHSPIQFLQQAYDEADYHLPAANDQATEKLSVYARKAPYHFGWDWGPRFVTSGIWKSVVIESWNSIILDRVHYRQVSLNDQEAIIHFYGRVIAEKSGTADLEISCAGDGLDVMGTASLQLKKGENNIDLEFKIPNPNRWWPNGLGDPTLYTLSAKISKGKQESQYTTHIGLREIELVREPDEFGESFYFKVNGIPVFMKGANYIPQDNFVNHAVSSEYEHLIQSVKEANMNMLRVWGGGIYEMDYFYELCDENGILVWQDFMFACSMYPGDHEFLENVRQEAIDNIVRLRNHPSLALWCGNNEIQDAWHQWGWQLQYSEEQKTEIAQNYQNLFHELLPEVLKLWDPDRPYWPSSPASGSDFGQTSNTQKGDLHYWGVWHGRRPFESYAEVIPRFSSEYGFQSFPALKTIQSFTWPSDLHLDSPVMKSHQRHPIGNQLIKNYMDRYYPVPKDFEEFVYVSQVMQGEGIRIGIEALRRSQPQCMGSLYWQLNDCWPVASWSGIDYFGRWKALHYQAKEAYAPLLISSSENADSIFIHLVSDQIEDQSGVLDIELIDFDGHILNSYQTDGQFDGLGSKIAWAKSKNDIEGLSGFESNSFLKITCNFGDKQLASAIHYFVRSKFMKLENPGLSWSFEEINNQTFLLIKTQKLAKQVYLDYAGEEEVRFHENFFDMLPGESRRIAIHKRDRDNFDPSKFRIL